MPGGFTAGVEPSVSALFTMLWDALTELLGPAATATLLKRAARRAAARNPELAELAIRRDGLVYSYSYICPSGWSGRSDRTPHALRDLIDELRPLLIEMTGQIAIRHLEQIRALRELLLAPQEKQK
jgi:hypothetical protein